MFVAVVAANVIAALFAFLGVAQVICFLAADARPQGAAPFIVGLSVASWPLAVAVLIYLLVQIACLLEKLYFAAGKSEQSAAKETAGSGFAVSSAPRFGKKDDVDGEETPEPPVFFKATTPAPPTPPAAPKHEEELDVKSAAAFAVAMDSARSSADEESTVVHHTDAEHDEWEDATPVVPEKPKSGLSFFKID